MTVPYEFVGAWERVEFHVDGLPVENPAATIWVQGHSAFCDLRVPLPHGAGTIESFAGSTSYANGRLHWNHELDLNGGPEAVTDEGDVTWDAGDLLETGVFRIDERDVPYFERWRRLAWSAGPVVEITDGGLRHVQVGSHALTIEDRRPDGAFSAAYVRDGVVVVSIGPAIRTSFANLLARSVA